MLSKSDILRRKYMWDTVEDAIRSFFQARGFTEVRTPLLVKTPGMEPNLSPFEVELTTENPHKVQRAGLITSPEYAMKKLVAAGLDRVFTITPVFRNREALSPHNTPEFLLLEWYAPGTYQDLLRETADLLNAVLKVEYRWRRIPHREAGIDAYGQPHVDERRFFVTEFPSEEAALAKLSEDGRYAERFEAFADRLELCNGYAELLDAREQRRRFEQEQQERDRAGKSVFPIDEELLQAIDRIKQPMYGNALGIDRLVMLKYGISDINDIQLFPANERFA